MDNALSFIKQPEPNVSVSINPSGLTTASNTQTTEAKKPKRVFNRPKVGVIDVPQISKTPLTDTLEIKKQENPHIKYKMPQSKRRGVFSLKEAASVTIFGCGIISLIKLIKKH